MSRTINSGMHADVYRDNLRRDIASLSDAQVDARLADTLASDRAMDRLAGDRAASRLAADVEILDRHDLCE